MTFNIISDIHYQPEDEYTKKGVCTGNSRPCQIDFDPSKLEPADYLLIAGDLATDDIFEKALDIVKEKTKGKFKEIFYIYGNHDYYDIGFTKSKMRQNHQIEVSLDENIVLLGTTLWTPVPNIDENAVVSRMNDFRAIPNWKIEDVREAYNDESSWLRGKVNHYKNLGKKVVVMTHHIPRVEIHPTYKQHCEWFSKNKRPDFWGYHASYYVTDKSCDDIKPDIWICGHHHTSPVDISIDNVRYVKNTIGYNGDWYDWRPQLPPTHWYDFIVEA